MTLSRRLPHLALLLGELAALALAFQETSAKFTVSGTVVEHATGRPLGGVLIILSPTSARDRRLTLLTGADGRFAFTNLPAAKYSLLAQRRGEQELHGYQGSEGFSTGIVAGPGMPSQDLTFSLEAPASVAGTVVDEDGEQVRQASVVLLRKAVLLGRSQVTQMDQKVTGSSGRFRFAHLPPGTYFVAVQAQPWYAQYAGPGAEGTQAANSRELEVAYPVTYYGDTTNGAAAAPIALAEGASVTVQIALHAVPAIHVPILGTEGSQGGMSASASVEGPGGVMLFANAVTIGANNSYELTGLAPGRYVIQFGGEGKTGSRQTMDLASGSTFSAQTTAAISVSGRVAFEGMDHPPNGVTVLLSDGKQSFSARIEQDGAFSFSNNAPSPGQYEVYVSNAPEAYVRSITAKGAPVSGDTVEIDEGASIQLSVVAARGVRSKLDGIAVKDDKPVAAAMILLLPRDLNRKALIRRDQSDSDGTFTLPEIVPGRYALLAIDDGRELAYQDPEVIKPYLAGAQLIDLPLKGDSPARVKVLSRHPQ